MRLLPVLTELVFTRTKLLLTVSAGVAIILGVGGFAVPAKLSTGGYTDPSADSSVGAGIITHDKPGMLPNLVIVVTDKNAGSADEASRAGAEIVDELRARGYVDGIRGWFQDKVDADGLRSKDGKSGLITARIVGDEGQVQSRVSDLLNAFSKGRPNISVKVGGRAVADYEQARESAIDLIKTELIALPVSAIILYIAFRTILAAALPILVGVLAILGANAFVRLLALQTTVSVFSLNLVTALALATSIDYCLLIVSRFREELANGLTLESAIRRTVRTACITVLYSAVPVALSLVALIVFPLAFIRSFAYAGVAAVGWSAVLSITITPAMLLLFGHRVNSSVRGVESDLLAKERRSVERWSSWTSLVVRHPWRFMFCSAAILLFAGAPFLHFRPGFSDDRVLRPSNHSRETGDILRSRFDGGEGASVVLVASANSLETSEKLSKYLNAVSTLSDVAAVKSSVGDFVDGKLVASRSLMNRSGEDLAFIATVVGNSTTQGDRGQSLVRHIRSVKSDLRVFAAGDAAESVDSLDAIRQRLPIAFIWITLTVGITLYVFTASILIPVKAFICNALSISATLGAMVWIFQDGHLSKWLNFTPTGYINPVMPVLMFCLAFGVSMDYEIFLLSRIKDRWMSSKGTDEDNAIAVEYGVSHTGRILTASAILMSVALGALTFSSVSYMQMFGLGLVLMLISDATIIRCTLVPSTMKLVGRRNWWNPIPKFTGIHKMEDLETLGQSASEPDASR